MSYSASNAKFLYTYFYRNQFLCFDSTLHLLYEGKTIDTIKQIPLVIKTMKSENISTLSSPPANVNKRGIIGNNTIYIQSEVMADNEPKALFKTCAVIDSYALESGSYLFSFYLPDFKNNRVKDFAVINNSLYALHGQYLICYELNPPK